MIATIAASIAPGIALLSYFYLRDRYEIEPLHMVAKTFLFGILLVFPVMVLQFGIQEEFDLGVFAKSFFIAGFIEEFFKWFIVYFTVYKHVEFDELYDGIVYAVAVSLGFATLENFIYLYSYGLEEALMRALLPVSSHALFGVIMGYNLGKGKFESKPTNQRIYMFYSVFLPFLLHGCYNFILYSSTHHYLWVIMPFMAILWFISMRRVRKAQMKSKAASF